MTKTKTSVTTKKTFIPCKPKLLAIITFVIGFVLGLGFCHYNHLFTGLTASLIEQDQTQVSNLEAQKKKAKAKTKRNFTFKNNRTYRKCFRVTSRRPC